MHVLTTAPTPHRYALKEVDPQRAAQAFAASDDL